MAESGPGTIEFIVGNMKREGYMDILRRNLRQRIRKLELPPVF